MRLRRSACEKYSNQFDQVSWVFASIVFCRKTFSAPVARQAALMLLTLGTISRAVPISAHLSRRHEAVLQIDHDVGRAGRIDAVEDLDAAAPLHGSARRRKLEC